MVDMEDLKKKGNEIIGEVEKKEKRLNEGYRASPRCTRRRA